MLQTFVHALFDVVGRESVVKCELAPAGPFRILRWDLCRRVEFFFRIRANELAQQTLAFALAIGPRSIEKVTAQIDRVL